MHLSLITYLSVRREDGKGLKSDCHSAFRKNTEYAFRTATFSVPYASLIIVMNDLIAKLKDGNEAAFKEVMAMYKKPIYNYLSLLLGNRQIAEELTQDTFVKVYFKAHTLKTDHPQACKAWIYSIATNLARSEFRKNRLKKIFSLSEVNERQVSYTPHFEGKLLFEQLLALVPEKWRVPLIMKEINNFSFEEISLMLNKPIGTVKSLVFRGKANLKKQYLDPKGAPHV